MIEGLLEGLERYGVSTVVIAAFLCGGVYVTRRLFNAENGLLTRITEKHIDFLERTTRCQEELTKSNAGFSDSLEHMAEEMGRRTRQLQTLIEHQHDRESLMSNYRTNRAALRACDALEAIADEFGCRDKVLHIINDIRRELKGE